MNPFDTTIIEFFNKYARVSWLFDKSLGFVSGNLLFKTAGMVSLLWWFWFRYAEDTKKRIAREHIISTLAGCSISLFIVKILIMTLPYRARPMLNPDLIFRLPYSVEPMNWKLESSFPSDHAALFFTMATGFSFISRGIGTGAFAFVILVICLPRIYLGLHYPTDILVSAILGIGVAWVVNGNKIRGFIAKPFLHWSEKAPASFYTCFFLLTYQIANLFKQIQQTAEAAIKYFPAIIGL